jgi:hypothetical protein
MPHAFELELKNTLSKRPMLDCSDDVAMRRDFLTSLMIALPIAELETSR